MKHVRLTDSPSTTCFESIKKIVQMTRLYQKYLIIIPSVHVAVALADDGLLLDTEHP